MTYVDVPVNVFLRFSLERFCITPDLIAAKHEFIFEGRPATLSLPGLDKDTVPPEQRRIECHKEWEQATDLSKINSLMNYRDRVMHSAETENIDAVELRKMHAAVKKFAYFTCDNLGLS
jgi:hypothetical protein